MSFLSEPPVDGCRLVGPNPRVVHTSPGLPGTRTPQKRGQLSSEAGLLVGVDGCGGIRTGQLRCSSEGFRDVTFHKLWPDGSNYLTRGRSAWS